MRITFVLPVVNFSGGIRVVAQLAQGLVDRGHTVMAVCPGRPGRSFKGKAYELLRSRRWPARDVSPLRSHFDDVRVPLRVLEDYRPVVAGDVPDADVVVSTWWETAHWVAALPPSKGTKAAFIQQYETAFGSPKSAVDAAWRLPSHKIVCAAWLAEKARKDFGLTHVDVVNNGVDLNHFDGPPRDRQRVFTVGLLYDHRPVKGFRIARRVLETVNQQVPVRTVAIGTDRPKRGFEITANTLMAYAPDQALLPELYARCDAWLCTSTSEGFHLPPHEAMACRTPVVSTRVGGPMDMVRDGYNGFLADVDDVPALAAHLLQIAALSPADWRLMSDHARTTAARYSWPLAAEAMERALEHAISRNGA